MSEPAPKAKKVVKKSTKKSNDAVPTVKTSVAQLETSSILENDYRSILAGYDPAKNKSRPIISIYERSLLIGKRATQIAYGANPLITVEPGMNEVEIGRAHV